MKSFPEEHLYSSKTKTAPPTSLSFFLLIMESYRSLTSNAIGFVLLPTELIQHIILRLALPDIVRLKSVNKSISSVISDQDFVRHYNLQSRSATWLFIYKKRWHRDSMLQGYTNRSNRWFKILIADILKSVIPPPGEDLYLLTASEMIGNQPILFEYDSRINQWSSTEAGENVGGGDKRGRDYGNTIFLSAYNGRSGSVVIAKGPNKDEWDTPVAVRPRFVGSGENDGGQLAVGFSWGNGIDRLHVYGDGNMMIVKSNGVEDVNRREIRVLNKIELWGLSPNGRQWELISVAPSGVIEKIKKPYGAMMGCLGQRLGVVRAILMSNLDGVWDIIWLSYDVESKTWNWLPIPDCKMKGANLAGIAFSSGLRLM